MFSALTREWDHFSRQAHNFRILVLTNFVYAFALPAIDIFVAAYIMRNSDDPRRVVLYQLAIYTGIPLTFFLNGFLIRKFDVRVLYSIGMLMSGLSMTIMMSLQTLDFTGLGAAGLTMGMSFGFYWANRDYLSLSNTTNENRNYYYGLETFLYTLVGILVPFCIGWFIQRWAAVGESHTAYLLVTGAVFLVTILASVVCFRGSFRSSTERKPFVFFRFHPLWRKFLVLASLKGMAQGFLVTAPAMLVMRLLGGEGILGTAQSIGAIVAAIALYLVGRYSKPQHRLAIFSVGLLSFAAAAGANAVLFNSFGVLLFLLFLLFAKPLMDLAYFPIQYQVINVLSKFEDRTEYAYILNHEAGIYAGRLFGAASFLILAQGVSTEFALRYAIVFIAGLQLFSIPMARHLIADCRRLHGSN